MVAGFLFSIIQYHVKTARKSYNKLLLFAKSVPSAHFTAGNIVNPVTSHDIERNVIVIDNERIPIGKTYMEEFYQYIFPDNKLI